MNRLEKVRTIVSTIMEVPIEAVTPESEREDYEKWDSLNQLNLVMEIESAFGISFSLEEMSSINSIKDILDILEDHLKA
ncbi:acyl carrier protein [Brevibacillus humidisoli]|uniref:acyl carrier protein n=1 Tax=Brevibacillus humidisoli TaxID=2895522 RepID=UPI001E47A335|nr:acyl carrier protein [Brevibacillus humidisoli]UFJ40040.1 acyl carrier protein [Brevibacillus humidisoli]